MEMYKDQSKTYQTRQESIPICNETVSQISMPQRHVRHRIFQSIWLVALNTVKDRYCTIFKYYYLHYEYHQIREGPKN